MSSYIERQVEALCGKAPHAMTPEDLQAKIATLRELRRGKALPVLSPDEPLKPRRPRKEPCRRPHKHKCEKCAGPMDCPVGPGCLEGPTFGLCARCGGPGLDPAKMRSGTVPPPKPRKSKKSLTATQTVGISNESDATRAAESESTK